MHEIWEQCNNDNNNFVTNMTIIFYEYYIIEIITIKSFFRLVSEDNRQNFTNNEVRVSWEKGGMELF